MSSYIRSLLALALSTSFACVGDSTPPPPGDGGSDATAIDAAPDASPPVDASTCEAGTTLCSGACVDLASSGGNCGACGHDCGGGTCSAGACAPVLVASNIAGPVGVAVAASSVFWLRSGAVERCPTTGCTGTPFVVTSDPTLNGNEPPGRVIVTDGNYVAWISNGSAPSNPMVYQCGVAGCNNGESPINAYNSLNDVPRQLALSGSTLYVAQATGTLHGGPIATLAVPGIGGVGDNFTGLAADATNVYTADTDPSSQHGADYCKASSCTKLTRLFNDANFLTVNATTLFGTSSVGVVSCLTSGCGGVPTQLAPTDTTAVDIESDDQWVAWVVPGSTTSATGQVRACKLPDCKPAPITLASAQAQPVALTISSGFVYWANKGAGAVPGSIYRLAL